MTTNEIIKAWSEGKTVLQWQGLTDFSEGSWTVLPVGYNVTYANENPSLYKIAQNELITIGIYDRLRNCQYVRDSNHETHFKIKDLPNYLIGDIVKQHMEDNDCHMIIFEKE